MSQALIRDIQITSNRKMEITKKIKYTHANDDQMKADIRIGSYCDTLYSRGLTSIKPQPWDSTMTNSCVLFNFEVTICVKLYNDHLH